ncbi:tRNA uracil 4-sulfurtransferase ThiI [Pseudalkalibacillus caeni]|uniref:Probable tRNA sulfurtransferase n=1 Tax=Exobacillus caeni TaxID=2574798 RepID=A0A5R9F9A9_9BACL|nr:tRNA uracil 4-sulfurtransferase ThiI [Pseudalkalibacillus caeni]TLS39099.1 tRNA 4-thiouridine(8) synthase ThiI [Pseudalkalibacillus caeni]
MYDQIIIRYGEIALKGKNQKEFVDLLRNRVKQKVSHFTGVEINMTFDRMYIKLNGNDHEEVIPKLQEVFGIHSMSLALKTEHDIEAMKDGALRAVKDAGGDAPRTFKVTSKRPYKNFPISSQELNQIIGAHILKNTENITVDVHNPDTEVRVEVKRNGTFISCNHFEGAGGLPISRNNRVMLMLSGGIDSPVAGYLTMKRGVKIEMVHFHSPPFTSERSRQKVEDLAKILTKFGGDLLLHVVHFTEVQKAIQSNIPSNYSMTIMRRMMMRITERLAEKNEALGIATGESLGQVASQTLHSMNTINEVTNYPIIRPLIAMDKVEIMKIAHKIGTYDVSIRPYEDCCTVFLPDAPKTRPKRKNAQKFEQSLDIESLIEEAISKTETVTLREKELINKGFEDLF